MSLIVEKERRNVLFSLKSTIFSKKNLVVTKNRTRRRVQL